MGASDRHPKVNSNLLFADKITGSGEDHSFLFVSLNDTVYVEVTLCVEQQLPSLRT